MWLRLVEHLGALREPAALPGWIRTTARNECLRLLAARGRTRAVDPQAGGLDTVTDDVTDVDLLAAERRQALRDALAELPEARRELLLLLLRRPAARVRGDQPPARHPDRQHRPDPRPRVRRAARHRPLSERLGSEPTGGPS